MILERGKIVSCYAVDVDTLIAEIKKNGFNYKIIKCQKVIEGGNEVYQYSIEII